MTTTDRKIDKAILSLPQRVGDLAIIVCMLLLLGFFVYHQATNTGFFTDKFGTFEMLCLYVPLLLGLTAPAVRAWTGRRNPARPFEITTSLFLTLGSLWLLIVFPFNYTHLADALPAVLHFVLAWVTDGIAKFFLLLQIVIATISAVITFAQYLTQHRREAAALSQRRV